MSCEGVGMADLQTGPLLPADTDKFAAPFPEISVGSSPGTHADASALPLARHAGIRVTSDPDSP